MGLIKKAFIKATCYFNLHTRTELVYSIQPKKIRLKGVESKKYHYDIYGIKRCIYCQKDIKEKLLKVVLTENQAIQYVDNHHNI